MNRKQTTNMTTVNQPAESGPSSDQKYREIFNRGRQVKQFMQNIPAAVAVLDRDMRYIAVTNRWLEDYRIPDRNIIGKSHYDVFPEIPERWKQIHQKCLQGNIETNEEDPFPRADGRLDWVRWEVNPWFEENGQVGGLIMYTEVITQRKEKQEYLESSMRQLRAKKRELETLNHELDAFNYSISHDLRAPLHHIEGFAHLLRDDSDSSLGDTEKRFLDNILTSTRRMNNLIDDLMKLAELTSERLVFSKINLTALCERIREELLLFSNNRQVEFKFEEDMTVFADENLMYIVMSNLLQNAWQFTAEREDALIEVGTRVIGRGHTVYYVRDNGCGFNPNRVDEMFLPFKKLHEPKPGEGSGVGLATVKRILYRMGGRVWAQGQAGEGACISFTFE